MNTNMNPMRQLATKIRTLPTKEGYEQDTGPLASFWMQQYACGTAGCIAGWAVQEMSGQQITEAVKRMYGNGIFEEAQNLLGISQDLAEGLFAPNSVVHSLIRADQASEMLERTADGIEDGSIVKSEDLEELWRQVAPQARMDEWTER